MEKTLIMIKPEAVTQTNGILRELDNYGERIMTKKVKAVSKQAIEKHYDMHKENTVLFERLVRHFTGKPTVIAVYQGENIVQKLAEVIGPTEPRSGTLRGKYSSDTFEQADKENRALQNAIHRSGTPKEAEYEITLW
ncbi:MAG: nucleoside-diphosphate kinase, partial [Nanoarchaeota archaeon]|nr:nucleoside-diphosphate kinase [Nanoarchaeota archaeon]